MDGPYANQRSEALTGTTCLIAYVTIKNRFKIEG